MKNHAHDVLLERIGGSSEWLDTTTLLDHLERHTEWGKAGNRDARRRTLQNWLKKLRETHVPREAIEADRAGGHGPWRYRRGRRTGAVTLEEACLSLLAERVLQGILPPDYLDSGLADRFRLSERRLEQHERLTGRNGDAVRRYLDGLAVASRGHRLGDASPAPQRAVGAISSAILQRRCLETLYDGRKRLLHPCGLVVREPKIYLLAIDDKRVRAAADQRERDTLAPHVYACARFESIEVSPIGSLAPEDFDATCFVDGGGLEIPLGGTFHDRTPVRLRLRVHEASSGALLRDIADHPLGSDQMIELDEGNTAIVTVPTAVASHALLEWIVGRLDRIEVLEPVALRAHVIERIEAMRDRYRSPPALATVRSA